MKFILTMILVAFALPVITGLIVYEPAGYSESERAEMNDLIERVSMDDDYLSQLEVALYKNGGKI